MQPNQISSIIPVGEQFAILKCEGQVPARNVPMETVRDELTEQIREGKLREVASKLFKELQDRATVQNVWNDPQLRAQMPGVVATINGEQIPYASWPRNVCCDTARKCWTSRSRTCCCSKRWPKANLAVTDQDLNDEIGHAAKLAGVVEQRRPADMEKWIETATKEQGVSKDQYMRDSVWPSAALKKLTGSAIQVTKKTCKKGFEANYGERVRCRAIVLANMRRAQEVWAKARQNTSMDYFGDLAEEYSIEPSSKSLRGEVPPIRRFGGQPQLEDVAFELQPGELSGIIQLGDKFVILKCEGRTEPVEVNPQEVHEILHQDIFEKKLRMAMSEKFEEIRAKARIDNFLAGTSQAPDRVKPDDRRTRQAPRVDAAVRPTSGASARGKRSSRFASDPVAVRADCTVTAATPCGRRYTEASPRSISRHFCHTRPCPSPRKIRRRTGRFKIQVAERVTRLPPYLFGRINALLYNKRRAGDDVIDLGMGNPSDPPEEFVIEKLAEAARDPRNHGYSKSNGIANLRREVAAKYFKRFGVRLDPDEEVIVCLGSKEGFSHMCLAMMGPGDTAIVPAPYFPDSRVFGGAGLGQRDRAGSARQRQVPVEHRVHVRASLSAAEAGDSQLPAQSVDGVHRAAVLRRGREARPQVRLRGDQRLRVRRCRVRRLPAAELPGVAGRGRGRRRVHDDEQGLQHGRLARRLLLRQSRR